MFNEMALTKLEKRTRIRKRIRNKISGTADIPRVSVFRSNRQIYAQVIDDQKRITLLSASSKEKEVAGVTGVKKNRTGKACWQAARLKV